uniref:26S proteasome non-ATPase regulatory subunit 5 n=1 Tax=Ditylenchus dipsaci TaxID=166011 RepID=A0A915CY30_9BILA
MDIDQSEYWPDVCELLESLLNAVPFEVMLNEHQITLLAVINNAPQRVILSIVNNYFKTITDPQSMYLFRTSGLAVTVALTRRVSGPICYEALAKFLAQFVDVKEVRIELENQLKNQKDAERRFRVYEVLRCAMALPTFSNYELVQPIMDSLVAELSEDDLLSCITALEVLSEIARSGAASNSSYLNQIGLLDKTYQMFMRSKDNPDGGLIHSACIRFFGHLSVNSPNALEKFSLFTSEIFDMIYHFDQVDATRRQLAFDTLAVMSTSSSAKQFLSIPSCVYNMRKAMNHFGVAIGIAPDELRTRHIDSLKTMLTGCQNSNDSNILLEWFKELGEPFPTMVYNFLRKPFEDLKISCLELLIAMVKLHTWAFNQFARVNGFLDYLLDRKSECSPHICMLKFDLVCAAIDAASTNHTIDEPTIEKLQKYKQEGVYGKSAARTADFVMDWQNN